MHSSAMESEIDISANLLEKRLPSTVGRDKVCNDLALSGILTSQAPPALAVCEEATGEVFPEQQEQGILRLRLDTALSALPRQPVIAAR